MMAKDTQESPASTDAPKASAGGKKQSATAWRRELGTKPTAFAAAVAMHGWRQHRHHTGKPMQLTQGEYEQAVTSAYELGKCHAPARSPEFGKRI